MLFNKNYNDYKPEKLPSTRREQYFDILKHNILLFLLLGLTFLLFLLPTLCSIFIRDYYYASYANLYSEGQITNEQFASLTNSLLNTMNIVIPISFIFISFPLAGILKILRRLSWSEPLFPLLDFFTGIKENILKILLFTLIICSSIYGLYSIKLLNNSSWFIKYVPFGLFACILIPLFLHFIILINIYNQSIGKTIKNSFVLFFKSPFITLLFSAILLLSIYLVGQINFIVIKILIYILLIVILLPAYLLLWYLYSISVLDKYINVKLFPEAYKKGLYIKEKNEEKVNREDISNSENNN